MSVNVSPRTRHGTAWPILDAATRACANASSRQLGFGLENLRRHLDEQMIRKPLSSESI